MSPLLGALALVGRGAGAEQAWPHSGAGNKLPNEGQQASSLSPGGFQRRP